MGRKLRTVHEEMSPEKTLSDRRRASQKNGFAVNTLISDCRSGYDSVTCKLNKHEIYSSPGRSVLEDVRLNALRREMLEKMSIILPCSQYYFYN
ncbi:hypothetical protein ACTXT7_017084 [Hymenolepis weldensis]